MTKRLEKKTNKKIMTKAGFCLFVVTIILFSLMLTISFSSFNWFNSNNTIEDWSYLDENSISGYKNGSYINNGEYISNDIIGVNNIQKVDASKSEAGGTSTAAVTISTLTNSYSFDSTTFATDTNVTWGEYSSANWDGRINCGTGYFGYKKGDATGRQAKIQNTAYTNIRISGDMLTLVKNGKLAFTLSGKYCAESGDNQTMAYGVIVSNSLKSAQAFSTIDSFRNAMTVASGSLSTTDSGSWDFDNIAYNFSSNSWTDCYITICVSSFSEYGSFIGGRCPSGYLSNLKLSFTLRQNYTVTFGRNNSGGTITSSSGTISKVADVLTSTASEGDGYLWTKWAIGSESGAQKTTAKALSINVINCLSDGTTYTAVFTAITYTITFSQNGKSGSPPASITVSGAAATSALPSSSSPDLIFAGWMLASNKSSPDYYVGGTFYPYTLNGTKTASITITLYALWQAAKPTYGGELTEENVSISPSSYTMYEDLTFTITAEKTGHSLASVYAKYDKGELTGTKVALEGSGQYWTLYGVCGDFTLSAEWKANTYTISYYVGTTKVSPGSSNSYWTIPSGAPTTGIYGTKINFRSFLPSCSNADYTFKGWTTTNGGSTYLGEQTITSNINAYLRYESSAIDGSYNSGWTASSGSAPSSTNNGDGKSGFGWAKKSNGDHDDSYYSYKTINFSSISDLHNYGAKTVDVTIGYACYARCYSTAFDSLSNTAYFYGGLSTSSVSSYSSVSKKSSKSVTATGTSQQQNVGTVNYSLSGITTSGFKIWFGARLVIDDAKWNCYPATYITSVTYKITTSANTSYTVTLNMNDSSTSISTKLLSGASLQLPYTTITKTGYSFKGWSTSSTANSASVLPGGAINVSSSATYYAVWEKKNYPIISYDVFTDGISYCTSIRKEWYRAYNESVTLNGTNQSSSSYSGANMYPKGGGNTDDYVGFTPNGGYNVTNRNGKSSNKWGYIAGTSASTITLTQAKWAYYIWQMDDPTSTKTDSTVIYGTSVNLESLVITDHGDDNAICSVGTWKVNDVAKVFYITGEPIIYAVDESATYSYTITATLTRSSSTTGATVTLTKSKISSQGTNPSVTINPIKLKLNAPTVSTLAYTGSEQEFLFTTTVDNESHTGSEYTNCVSVFNRERDLGTGQPYYYNSGGNNSGYWAGVTTYLVGTGYRSNIGEYYTQGSVVFKDAGTYWVNNIQIRRYIGVRQGEANTNYVWKTNDSQALSADTQNSSGTVTATITPKNGFDIYAFYTYKTFGQVSDPTKIAINMDDEDYDDKLSNGDYEQTDWYLGITGLYVVDFTEFSSTILGGLVRDTSDTLNNAAGLYDVTLTLNSTSFPPRLINNYGCQVSSANYTYLSTSTINMYFYNNSYTKMSNTGYNFTSSTLWTGYSQSHNNYEIKPREVSMSIGQYAATTYDGNSHGITMTVNGSDLLTTEEQTALISVSQNYNKYLEVYFYGIPMPANWSSIENKEQYIEDNSNSKQIVGIKETNEETRRYVKNAQKNQLDFKEINAGGYGVLIIGTAYSTDGGTTFAENPDYKLPSYFSFSWEIKKLII